jgi:hypothetical protein
VTRSLGRYISPKLKSHHLPPGKNDHAPRPQRREAPADVIGNAVHVMRIATGEIEETTPERQGKEYARNGGAGAPGTHRGTTPSDDARASLKEVGIILRSIVKPFVMSRLPLPLRNARPGVGYRSQGGRDPPVTAL